MGRSALETINALDAGPNVPAPSAYLLFSGKVVPAWAIRLFVLALILPVLAATSTAWREPGAADTRSCAGSRGCSPRRCRSCSR